MSDFPSLTFVTKVQQYCNDNVQFNKASKWSDVNLVLALGDQRFWMKMYDGRIIDVAPYEPMTNALGYDVIVSGSMEAWGDIASGAKTFWNQFTQGQITIDGRLLEANRIHEAIVLISEAFREVEATQV